MPEVATQPIIDNTATDPEIAKLFAAPKQNPFFDFLKSVIDFLIHATMPMYIGMYRAYVSYRASSYQAQLAQRSFYISIGIAIFLSYAWLVAFQNLAGDSALYLRFTFWNFVFLWLFITAGLNFYCGARFSKPDYRALNIKFSPSKKGQVASQIVKRLGAKAQLKEIGKTNWRVDYWRCDARIHWREFPDDSIIASCIGTNSKEWIWIRFNDARYEKHIGAVFGDLGYGKKNFVRVLIKAALGDPNTGIVICDADEAIGFSFSEYEGLLNVALNIGIKKSQAAIQMVWNELRSRIAERMMIGKKQNSRLILVLDENFSKGIYGFWSKGVRELDVTDELKNISRRLKEIVDAGKMHNIHVICVYDNSQFDFKAWKVGHQRFENFATYWKGTIQNKGKDGKVFSETITTHDFPFMDMITITWPGGIIFKTMYLPEAEFIQYVKERSVYLSRSVKEFLDDIRHSKIEN